MVPSYSSCLPAGNRLFLPTTVWSSYGSSKLDEKTPAWSGRKGWAAQVHEIHTLNSLAMPRSATGSIHLTHRAEKQDKLMWRCTKLAASRQKVDMVTKDPSHHTFSSKARTPPRCSTLHLSGLKRSLQLVFDLRHPSTLWLDLLFLWEQGSSERRSCADAASSSNHLEGTFGRHLVQSQSGTTTTTRTCQLCLCLAESWKLPRIEVPPYL